MRVTFVQPLQGTKFGFTKILRVEPLGMECVSSTLKLHDHETYYVDLRLDKPRVLENHLRDWKPHAVGIACGFSTDVYTALEGARQIKDVLPDTLIFTGGHHSSLVPGDLLFSGSPIDAVVVGEGEWPTLDLIDGHHDTREPGKRLRQPRDHGRYGRSTASRPGAVETLPTPVPPRLSLPLGLRRDNARLPVQLQLLQHLGLLSTTRPTLFGRAHR